MAGKHQALKLTTDASLIFEMDPQILTSYGVRLGEFRKRSEGIGELKGSCDGSFRGGGATWE